MKKTGKKAAVGFIFITLLIDITGWGIILPVVPKLIGELIHSDITEAATYGVGWVLLMLSLSSYFHQSSAILVTNTEDVLSY
ncbi:hypothetical protein ACR78J_12690 [Sphingobacterium spiritivorum]|uniref:hypothetical protein n=1 Tax=Sphingobacterium spiritivorum TaxID=258 RepID=UPI003DA45492